MSSRDHTQALLARLREHPDLEHVVFDGEVGDEAPTGYVLVFAHPMSRDKDRFAVRQRPLTARHTIHSIGATPVEAQWINDRVTEQLQPDSHAVRLSVDGRKSGPLEHEAGDPMRVDSSRAALAYFLADQYAWHSQPRRSP